jgi:protein-disulfide isomerase/rhodanese-related sulfurtransferase
MRKPAAFALALLALFDSLYLWWVYASPSHPLACLGGGCDVVRASRYAQFLGFPTPAYGVLLYAVLALLLFSEPLVAPLRAIWLRRLTCLLAGAGSAVALWLTGIETFVLHAWCTWCTIQWMAVTLIFVLSLSLLRAAPDAAGALGMVRRQSAVLLVAIVVGVPAFTHLMRATEALPPAAALPSAAALAQRLIRPDSHVTGNPQAAVSLVEFGDLQCPSCAASEQTVRELRQRYGDRVRFVFRQFPLERIHRYALHAAEATECAADQGKFWEALDRLYRANGELNDDSLKRYAAELGLDMGKFNACMSSGATLARIRRDADDGHALGVRATPTFFIGRQRVEGALDMARFEQLLGQELASSGPAPAPVAQEKKKTTPAAKPAPKSASPTGSSSAAVGFGGASNPFVNIQGASTDCTQDAPTGPEPAMIRTPRAEELYRAKSLFVDVRSPVDFQKERIAGAINIPMNEVGSRANTLPHDRTIVLYERSSGASGDVCAASRAVGRVLLSRGYRQVLVYQDGLEGWQKQSLPVER